MKKTLSITIILILSVTIYAQKVSSVVAKKIAGNYYNANSKFTTKSTPVLASAYFNGKDTLLYIYNFDNHGFVIVSGNYSIKPILAFSDETTFDPSNLCPAVNNIIESYVNAVKFAEVEKSSSISAKWDIILNDNYSSAKKESTKSIAPLLTTRWDQGANYNYHCPEYQSGPGGRCYAGCVATAMGQIMKYYNFPNIGVGSHSYYHPYYETISANFGQTNYDWASMTNTINTSSKESISTLLFHCGVSVDMYYTPTGSASQSYYVINALKNYFNYRSTMSFLSKSSYSRKDWIELLMDDLDDSYPILYSGSGSSGGHAWVCDGYSADSLFHMNWGWGGAANGYFDIDSLNSGNGDFSSGQDAILYITTYYAPYCKTNKIITKSSGTVSNGSQGSYYWNDTDCDWLISPDTAEKIILTFNKFYTEADKDFVSIYDGTTTSAPLLGTYSGHNIPPVLQANSGKMLIVFTSNETVQDLGWDATYYSYFTDVKENNIEQNFSIYPNPAVNYINLITNSSFDKKSLVKIYSITGELMYSKQINLFDNATASIDVSNYPCGLYIIQINSGDKVFHKKFIK